MAASAAAIVKIKIENICPLISLRKTEAETKLMLAAKKIISMHIKIKIIFLRLRNSPKHPIIKTINDRIKK